MKTPPIVSPQEWKAAREEISPSLKRAATSAADRNHSSLMARSCPKRAQPRAA